MNFRAEYETRSRTRCQGPIPAVRFSSARPGECAIPSLAYPFFRPHRGRRFIRGFRIGGGGGSGGVAPAKGIRDPGEELPVPDRRAGPDHAKAGPDRVRGGKDPGTGRHRAAGGTGERGQARPHGTGGPGVSGAFRRRSARMPVRRHGGNGEDRPHEGGPALEGRFPAGMGLT